MVLGNAGLVIELQNFDAYVNQTRNLKNILADIDKDLGSVGKAFDLLDQYMNGASRAALSMNRTLATNLQRFADIRGEIGRIVGEFIATEQKINDISQGYRRINETMNEVSQSFQVIGNSIENRTDYIGSVARNVGQIADKIAAVDTAKMRDFAVSFAVVATGFNLVAQSNPIAVGLEIGAFAAKFETLGQIAVQYNEPLKQFSDILPFLINSFSVLAGVHPDDTIIKFLQSFSKTLVTLGDSKIDLVRIRDTIPALVNSLNLFASIPTNVGERLTEASKALLSISVASEKAGNAQHILEAFLNFMIGFQSVPTQSITVLKAFVEQFEALGASYKKVGNLFAQLTDGLAGLQEIAPKLGASQEAIVSFAGSIKTLVDAGKDSAVIRNLLNAVKDTFTFLTSEAIVAPAKDQDILAKLGLGDSANFSATFETAIQALNRIGKAVQGMEEIKRPEKLRAASTALNAIREFLHTFFTIRESLAKEVGSEGNTDQAVVDKITLAVNGFSYIAPVIARAVNAFSSIQRVANIRAAATAINSVTSILQTIGQLASVNVDIPKVTTFLGRVTGGGLADLLPNFAGLIKVLMNGINQFKDVPNPGAIRAVGETITAVAALLTAFNASSDTLVVEVEKTTAFLGIFNKKKINVTEVSNAFKTLPAITRVIADAVQQFAFVSGKKGQMFAIPQFDFAGISKLIEGAANIIPKIDQISDVSAFKSGAKGIGQGFADFIKKFVDLLKNIDTTKLKNLDSLSEILVRFSTVVQRFADIPDIGAATDKIRDGLQDLLSVASDTFKLGKVGDLGEGIGKSLGAGLKGAGKFLIGGIKDLVFGAAKSITGLGEIDNTGEQIGNAIVQTIYKTIVAGKDTVVGAYKYLLSTDGVPTDELEGHFQFFGAGILRGLDKGLGATLGTSADILDKYVVDVIRNTGEDGNIAGAFGDVIKQDLTDGLAKVGLTEPINKIVTKLEDTFAATNLDLQPGEVSLVITPREVVDALHELDMAAQTTVEKTASGIAKAFYNPTPFMEEYHKLESVMRSEIESGAQATTEQVATIVNHLFDAFFKGFSDSKIGNFIQNAAKKIFNPKPFKQEGDKLAKTAEDVADNVAKGFDQSAVFTDVAENSGKTLFESFADTVLGLFRIKSPSQWAIEVAKNVIAGFKTGIEVGNDIVNIARNLAERFKSGLETGMTVAIFAIRNPLANALSNVLLSLQQQFDGFANTLAQRGRTLVQRGIQEITVGGVAGFFQKSAVTLTASFQQMLKQIEVFGGEAIKAAGGIDVVKQAITDFSKQTIFTANEASEAFLNLLKSGLDAATAMKILPQVGALAAASNMTLAQSTELTVRAASAFNIAMTDSTRVVNAFVGAADISTAGVDTLAAAFGYVGNDAQGLKVSIEETAAALALLNDRGIVAERAGTGLRQVFNTLASPTDAAKKAFAELGVQVFDTKGEFVGFEKFLSDLSGSLVGKSTEDINRLLGALGDTNAVSALKVLISRGADANIVLSTYVENLSHANSAQTIAAELMDTFKGKLTSLKGSFQVLLMNGIGPFLEAITPLTEHLITFVNALATLPPQLLGGITAAIAMVTTLITLSGVVKIVSGVLMSLFAPALKLVAIGIGTFRNLLFLPASFISEVITMTGAFIALAGIVSVLVGAFISFKLTLASLRKIIRDNINGVGDKFDELKSNIYAIFNSVRGALDDLKAVAGGLIDIFIDATTHAFGLEGGFNSLAEVAGTVADKFNGVLGKLRSITNEVGIFIDFVRQGLSIAGVVAPEAPSSQEQIDAQREALDEDLKKNEKSLKDYKIKSGDTLSQIALTYGVTVDELLAANSKIKDKNLIYAGDTLRIPIDGAADAATGLVANLDKMNDTVDETAAKSEKTAEEIDGIKTAATDMFTPASRKGIRDLTNSVAEVGDVAVETSVKTEQSAADIEKRWQKAIQLAASTSLFKSLFGEIDTTQTKKFAGVITAIQLKTYALGFTVGRVAADIKDHVERFIVGAFDLFTHTIRTASHVIGFFVGDVATGKDILDGFASVATGIFNIFKNGVSAIDSAAKSFGKFLDNVDAALNLLQGPKQTEGLFALGFSPETSAEAQKIADTLTAIKNAGLTVIKTLGAIGSTIATGIGYALPVIEFLGIAFAKIVYFAGLLYATIAGSLLNVIKEITSDSDRLAKVLLFLGVAAAIVFGPAILGAIAAALPAIGLFVAGWAALVVVFKVLEEVIDPVMNIIASVVDFFIGFGTIIHGIATGDMDLVTQGFYEMGAALLTFLGNIVSLPAHILTGLVRGIQAVGNIVMDMFDLLGIHVSDGFRDSFNSIFDGIGEWLDKAIEAGSKFGKGLLDGFKEFLGIASPSKKFAALGKDIQAGLLMGLKSLPGALLGLLIKAFGALRTIGGFALKIGGVILEALINALANIDYRKVGETLIGVLGDVLSFGFSALSGIYSTILPAVIEGVFGFLEGLTGLDLGGVSDFFVSLSKSIGSIYDALSKLISGDLSLGDFVTKIIDIVSGLGADIIDALIPDDFSLSALWDAIKFAFENPEATFELVKTAAVGAFTKVVDFMLDLGIDLSPLWDAAKFAFDNPGAAFDLVKTAAVGAFQAVIDGLNLNEMFTNAVAFAANIFESLFGPLDTLLLKFEAFKLDVDALILKSQDFILGTMDFLVRNLTDGVNKIIDQLNSIPGLDIGKISLAPDTFSGDTKDKLAANEKAQVELDYEINLKEKTPEEIKKEINDSLASNDFETALKNIEVSGIDPSTIDVSKVMGIDQFATAISQAETSGMISPETAQSLYDSLQNSLITQIGQAKAGDLTPEQQATLSQSITATLATGLLGEDFQIQIETQLAEGGLPEALSQGIYSNIDTAIEILQSNPDLANKMGYVVGNLLEFKDDFKENGITWGTNIHAGMQQGLAEGQETTNASAQAMTDGVKNTVEGPGGFDTQSPSRWSQNVSYNLIAGFVLGITETEAALYEKVYQIVAIVKSMENNVQQSTEHIQAAMFKTAMVFVLAGNIIILKSKEMYDGFYRLSEMTGDLAARLSVVAGAMTVVAANAGAATAAVNAANSGGGGAPPAGAPHARGGNVSAGTIYPVNETMGGSSQSEIYMTRSGRQYLLAGEDGVIISPSQSRTVAGGGGHSGDNVTIEINAAVYTQPGQTVTPEVIAEGMRQYVEHHPPQTILRNKM